MVTQKGKTAFLEFSSTEEGQHFMTIIHIIGHDRTIIGRMYREYDKDQKKMIYTATDWEGNLVFRDTNDIATLKKKFIESGKTMAQAKPIEKNNGKNKTVLWYKTPEQRQKDLTKTREGKSPKQKVDKEKEPKNKSQNIEKDEDVKYKEMLSENKELDKQAKQINNPEPEPGIENIEADIESFEKSDRDRELEDIRGRDDDMDKNEEQEVEIDI